MTGKLDPINRELLPPSDSGLATLTSSSSKVDLSDSQSLKTGECYITTAYAHHPDPFASLKYSDLVRSPRNFIVGRVAGLKPKRAVWMSDQKVSNSAFLPKAP
jgi:hypothetical protein